MLDEIVTTAQTYLRDCLIEYDYLDNDAKLWDSLLSWSNNYRLDAKEVQADIDISDDDIEEYLDNQQVAEFLGHVVTYGDEVALEYAPDVIVALVNANPDKFVLHTRVYGGSLKLENKVLELHPYDRHPTAISLKKWTPDQIASLNCHTDSQEPHGGWYSSADLSGKKAIDGLIAETLSRSNTWTDGSFNLHWKNGEKVEFGQQFRPLGVASGERDKAMMVDSVSILNGTPRAYVYSNGTGYPIDSCEPVRENPTDTTYDLDGGAKDGFWCAKCHKRAPMKSPVYCPSCGRRVL